MKNSAKLSLQIGEGFITKGEVALRLNKSVRTVTDWQRKGFIPYIKLGKSVFYSWSAILARLGELCIISDPTHSGPPSPFAQRQPGGLLEFERGNARATKHSNRSKQQKERKTHDPQSKCNH